MKKIKPIHISSDWSNIVELATFQIVLQASLRVWEQVILLMPNHIVIPTTCKWYEGTAIPCKVSGYFMAT
jgi:hypothetical protein